MARIGRPGRSKKPKDKNVLKVRNPNGSKGARYSNNSRSSRYSNDSRGLGNSKRSNGSRGLGNSKRPNGSRGLGYPNNSRNGSSSIWSRNTGPKKPRSPKQILIMALILFAFICGLALGISMIMGIGDSGSDSGNVEYMNVTNNITVYENSSYDLEDENGTQISYYDFDENLTEGQNITAFDVSNSANIY